MAAETTELACVVGLELVLEPLAEPVPLEILVEVEEAGIFDKDGRVGCFGKIVRLQRGLGEDSERKAAL